MFWAKNKVTTKDVTSLADYSLDFFKDEIWYALPNDIEKCPENIDINTIEVRWRKESKEIINDNGTIYHISPHFYIVNGKKLGIISKKISKEHLKCQNFVAQYIKNNILTYSFKDEMFDFDFDINTLRYEAVKESVYKSIRADIIIKFKQKDVRFGRGIIFEIQLSKQRDKEYKNRTIDRALTDYSVVWIKKDDFEDYKSDNLELNKTNFTIFPVVDVLKKWKDDFISEFKELTINYTNMLSEKIKEEVKDQIVLRCPKCDDYLINKTGRYGDFKGCNSYPKCGYILRGKH